MNSGGNFGKTVPNEYQTPILSDYFFTTNVLISARNTTGVSQTANIRLLLTDINSSLTLPLFTLASGEIKNLTFTLYFLSTEGAGQEVRVEFTNLSSDPGVICTLIGGQRNFSGFRFS